jgi:hypothetical protein
MGDPQRKSDEIKLEVFEAMNAKIGTITLENDILISKLKDAKIEIFKL